jgi:hypothetical protein
VVITANIAVDTDLCIIIVIIARIITAVTAVLIQAWLNIVLF